MLVSLDFLKNVLNGFKKDIEQDINTLKNVGKIEPSDTDIPIVNLNGSIPINKNEVFCVLDYSSLTDSFRAYAKIKIQGNISTSFPKKNFSIELYSDESTLIPFNKEFKNWGAHNEYVLKANWIDHLHARNIASANLWADIVRNRNDFDSLPKEYKNSPNMCAIDGFPIKVYANGEYQGIYTWNIPKKTWMFNMDKSNPNHVVLQGNVNDLGDYSREFNPCNFNVLWDGKDSNSSWTIEEGNESDTLTTSFNKITKSLMAIDDSDVYNYPVNITYTDFGEFADINGAYLASKDLNNDEIDIFNELIVGNIYDILWDGVSYKCTCMSESQLEGSYYFGNLSIANPSFENTGEPFIIMYQFVSPVLLGVVTTDEGTTHTFTISNKEAVNNELKSIIASSGLEDVLDIQSAINYFIFQNVIFGHDNFGNNLLFLTYDMNKWYMTAYDMDSTYDLNYDGTILNQVNGILPDDGLNKFSLLFSILNSFYKNELTATYKELRKSVLSYSNIISKFEKILSVIDDDVRIEDTIPYPEIPSVTENTFVNLKKYLKARLEMLDRYFDGMEV